MCFYGKVQSWSSGADIEKSAVLCVNCMLCRLTAGNCMLLRWKLVPMEFFSHGWKVCQHHAIVTDPVLCYISKRIDDLKLWSRHGILILLFFDILLFCQTEIASGLPSGVYMLPSFYFSPSLSLSFWDNAGLRFTFFFLLEIQNFAAAVRIPLRLPVLVPGDTSLRMAALICRKTSWEYWFQKVLSFLPLEKKTRKNGLLCENL